MIGSIRGTVLERTATGEVLVEVGGVGYRASVPTGTLVKLIPGEPAFLFTHLHVREDAMVLFGFPTRDERDTFEALLGVGRRPEARARDPERARAERLRRALRPTTSMRSCSCPVSAGAPRSACSST